MKTTAGPVTDFFGGRLAPDELAAGARAQGLSRFRLIVGDDEVLLRAAEGQDEALDRAVTWLRGRFSPLTPCRGESVRSARGLDERLEDRRRRPVLTVALAEVFDEARLPAAAAALFSRLGCAPAPLQLIKDWRKLPARGGPGLVGWRRPGGAEGVRPATILAASADPRALSWLLAAVADETTAPPADFDVLLDGLEWAIGRRPTVAARARAPIAVDAARCDGCGLCAEVCPTDCLDARGLFKKGSAQSCLGCFDCVEACPQDALRPRYGDTSATSSRALAHRPGWLSRLRGAPGPAQPAPFPPSYLLPRPKGAGKPRWTLGLAVSTMQEHAAALLDRGQVAGAVEEERLSRVRHHGYRPPGRPGVTITVDPTIQLEEALCRRAVGALLAPRGLTLDDIDLFAVNGIPARYRRAYSLVGDGRPLAPVRAGRALFVPHHQSHAASAWRLSGQKESWVLTVDGRGDRETAAVFKAARGTLTPVREVLSLTDRSIGGVYEGATRLLGFGPHGQGSVMALASYGKPALDLAAFLSRRGPGDYVIHEEALARAFAALARRPGAPLKQAHKDLAASVQAALESLMLALLEDAGAAQAAPGLCLAGGVALNCRMNESLRRALKPKAMFVQPGANDAGTALGAALEAAALSGLAAAPALTSARLGPAFTPEEARAALEHAGLESSEPASLAAEAAALLARGEVVCWCQGRMEFGPRALGGRSILADPRRADMHARVNRIKQREPWRPFGPSILAGHEKDWFESAFESPFMLFALALKAGCAELVPAVAHVDGTSRPQSVRRDADPLYHELITRFHAATGVPMLLNTSFNRRDEPIVASPSDAASCFSAMREADALALGPFLARRPRKRRPAPAKDEALAALPGGRRLLLRLNARCESDCVYCSIRDLAHLEPRSFDAALRSLIAGRKAGCSELVVMRGEPTLWPALARLLRRARAMGYSFIQLQTSGRALSRELLSLVDSFELSLFGAQPATHDALARSPGAFRSALLGARAATAAGRSVILHVPVLRSNLRELAGLPALAKRLGAARLQLGFPRPVETKDGVETEELPRLSQAAPFVRAALRAADAAGVAASTEAFPFCGLDPDQRTGPDSARGWERFRVDDLDRLQEALDPERSAARPQAPACRACREKDRCPRTWALYLALFGGAELAAIA